MKKLYFGATFLFMLVILACNQSVKTQNDNTPASEQDDAVLFISKDGNMQFSMLNKANRTDGIVLKDLNSGAEYQLKPVEAASGTKYSNDQGNTFWTKGNEFMWMKGDELITSGMVKRNDFSGSYVTPDYFRRNEGYDWVAVRVKSLPDKQLRFQVRSRADKKEPTCTLDITAYPESQNKFYSMIEGKKVIFSFLNDTLEISPQNQADENVLYFSCSGGATVAGSYFRIDEELDPEQVDPTVFSKVLYFQGIGFNVSSIRKEDGTTEISVFPFGLELDNRIQTQTTDGFVVDAETEDLNADGSPELLIYTQTAGSGSYGNVIAYSVNSKKSMSTAFFPPMDENASISKGYMGHDEFRIVENMLVRRFPIYNEGDSNASPGGGIRQISYKLVEGEAMRRFEIADIIKIDRPNTPE